MTITEAMAEIKTIAARIEKKREAVIRYLARDAQLRDPIKDEGGSVAFVQRELQGILDLERLIVKLRSAIQAVNLQTTLTVEDQTSTITDWLTWRREIADRSKGFLAQMLGHITSARNEATKRQYQIVDATKALSDGEAKQTFLVNVDERALNDQIEKIESIINRLDGKLSLVNATTMITVTQ